MPLTLTQTRSTTVPLEVEGITPDRLRELSLDALRRLDIFHGNQKVALGEFFQVAGDASDLELIWQGDMSGVHWIGAKMREGMIRVAGSGGRHVGSEMYGGRILVEGDVGDWLGGEMHGGVIQVQGRAGHLVGAAYRGSPRGMTGGTILVQGAAGNEIGHTMRRGLIAVGGSSGDLSGFNMLAGTVLAFGECGIRPGASMRRGTLGFLGSSAPPLLPSFRHACRYQPNMLRLIFRYLQEHGYPVSDDLLHCSYDLFHGDLLEGGRGEVLVPAFR